MPILTKILPDPIHLFQGLKKLSVDLFHLLSVMNEVKPAIAKGTILMTTEGLTSDIYGSITTYTTLHAMPLLNLPIRPHV